VFKDPFLDGNILSPHFPHPLLTHQDGIISFSSFLHVKKLIFAYRLGIFPWYNGDSPFVFWHFPPERMLLPPENIKVAKSMRTYFNNQTYTYTFNTCFVEVMKNCRETRHSHPDDSWIHYTVENAYFELHKMGLAHSLEVWDRDQNLVGGLYGVGVGHVFTGESMFYKKRDASKFALIVLARTLQTLPGSIIDCQLYTPHLESMGAHLESLHAFWQRMKENFRQPLQAIENHLRAFSAE
jgi:leucyl/phenylalanyl-tRNA--protein transferase